MPEELWTEVRNIVQEEVTKIIPKKKKCKKAKWLSEEALHRGAMPLSMGFPGGSVVKNLPAMQETWVGSLCWEDPLVECIATYSSILG